MYIVQPQCGYHTTDTRNVNQQNNISTFSSQCMFLRVCLCVCLCYIILHQGIARLINYKIVFTAADIAIGSKMSVIQILTTIDCRWRDENHWYGVQASWCKYSGCLINLSNVFTIWEKVGLIERSFCQLSSISWWRACGQSYHGWEEAKQSISFFRSMIRPKRADFYLPLAEEDDNLFQCLWWRPDWTNSSRDVHRRTAIPMQRYQNSKHQKRKWIFGMQWLPALSIVREFFHPKPKMKTKNVRNSQKQ